MTKKHYFFNGLVIESEIEFEDLTKSKNEANTWLQYGEIPDQLENCIYKDEHQSLSETEYLLDIPDVGKYLVLDKKEIIVCKDPKALTSLFNIYLGSWIFPFILSQRSVFSLHACSFIIKDQAFLFSGASGVGKSTLTLNMNRKGHTGVNDDLCAFHQNDKTFDLLVGPRSIKLLKTSIELIGETSDDYQQIREDLEKYKYPGSKVSSESTFPVKAFFAFNPNIKENACRKLSGFEAFKAISSNVFRLDFVKMLGKMDEHFKDVSQFASKVTIFEISRSDKMSPEEFADFVEQSCLNLL